MGTGLYCEGWYIDDFMGKVVRQDDDTGVKVVSTVDEILISLDI